ncbi:MAG: NAD(P)/FAD-dependent oxidoreductase [Acidimicrobiia bacterium]|nr:NAD(P)/FAD-dependent oxidoreductase [Acidimicrobiia bacterium]
MGGGDGIERAGDQPAGGPAAASGGAPETVIIGAGPAGLTAAYELAKRGITSTVLEADDVVGGISRTVERDGWRFDIGGHRFFTKVRVVDDLWFEILGRDEFLRRPRMSRILYRGKLYDYPIAPLNALRNLGFVEAVRCVLSYVWVRIKPPRDQTTFEGFTASRFGWRLYRTFFKTYTEKVWGVPATEIQADWGAQRIKNLSLFRAVWEALKPKGLKARQGREKQVTSLIEEFNYPKYGPGMMWERATELVTARGTKVLLGTGVTTVHHDGGRAVAVTAEHAGVPTRYPCTHVISSMPLGQLVEAMVPPPPPEVLAAARALTYRDFMTVALVVPEDAGFPDNWVYIHDPDVAVGRVQNFGSWSPFMVKEGRTCLGLEFFVDEGDDMWTKSDEALVEQGKRELEALGLVDASRVEAGYVVRIPKAYPMYDDTYKANVQVMREWLEANVPNVFPVGRNGMHRYNNQDHSMYTAMLSVENILGATHDVWAVNVEAEYHEERHEDSEGTEPIG